MTDDISKLVAAAKKAAAHAYAPYSNFGVGAAVLLQDGEIISGCNFENASYGLSLCAETVALATTNAQGKLAQVRAIAVSGGKIEAGAISGHDTVYPCGRCRQIINEAAGLSGHDIAVHCTSAEGEGVSSHNISVLLPNAFGPDALV